MQQQISMFDLLNEEVKITKPIRLIEFFAGYGSQNLALKYLGANYESWKICEWATKSIQAYKDLHFENDNVDYSSGMSFEQVIDYLFEKGISADYNKPMEYSQIKRKGEKWCRQVYNNIIATDNLVNIQQVKGTDLEIVDVNDFDYVMTYSFPCQDLSLAGKGAGMSKDSGTRSSMLWEVGRILRECSEIGSLPQILLMENVTQVHSKKNKEMFDMWIKELDELGYTSYWQDMNAKNFGIPQNRNRTFMISILRSWSCGEYKFPKGFELKLRLRDMLEEEVDEKYYLSDKMIKYITADNEKWTGNNGQALINKQIASTLNTGEGSRRCDASNYICNELPEKYDLKGLKQVGQIYGIEKEPNPQTGRIYDSEGLSPTLDTCSGGNRMPKILIPEKTLKGYAEAYEGDEVYINRPHQKRGCVQSGSYMYQINNLRIRKLTPRECWRLMGVQDQDYDKVAPNQSASSLYHLSGDSIVCQVLISLFSQLIK